MPAATRLAAGARRQSLVDAGWHVLVNHGARAVTIDAVVQRLDISRPIFYRHFADRVDLLVALYERYAEDLLDREGAVFSSDIDDYDELVHGVVRAYLDKVGQDGPALRALIHEAQDDPRMIAARARLRDTHAKLWRNAAERMWPDALASTMEGGADAAVLSVLLEMHQEAAVQGATAIMEGRASRREVERALAVLNDGLAGRLAAHLRKDQQ